MSSYQGPAGSIGFASDALVPLSAKTIIELGAGMAGAVAPDGQSLLLNTVSIDAPEVFDIFVPGVLSAATLGVWHNGRANNRANLISLELNALTPQSTASATDYYEVQLADAAGNKLTLPLTVASQAHYVNSVGPSTIAQPYLPGTGTTNDVNKVGYAAPFQPTEGMSIVGIGIAAGLYLSNQSTTGVVSYPTGQIRVSLLDDNENVLATGHVTYPGTNSTGAPANPAVNIPTAILEFAEAVALTADTTYWIVWDVFENGYIDSNGDSLALAAVTADGAAQSGQPITIAVNGYDAYLLSGTGSNSDPTLPAQLTKGALPTGYQVDNASWTGNFAQYSPALIGSGTSVLLIGDATMSVVAVGAPVATDAPTNTNIRALLLPAPSAP